MPALREDWSALIRVARRVLKGSATLTERRR